MLPTLADEIDAFSLNTATPIRQAIPTAMQTGPWVVLMRLSNVDSLSGDPAVTVSLYRGFSISPDCSTRFTGAGQFVVDNSGLTTPGDLTTSIWQVQGSIAGGRLLARYGTQSGLAAEAPPGFPVNQLAFRVNLDSTGGSGTSGNAGGWSTGDQILGVALAAHPSLRSGLNGLLPQIFDLPSLSAGSCGGAYAQPSGGMGLGARFQMVQAVISGTAAAPPTGACGS